MGEITVGFTSGRGRLVALVFSVSLGGLGQAAAQSSIVDEAKIGMMAHDITLGGRHVEDGADVSGEILFVSPSFLGIIGSPRPHLGGWVNTDGNTNAAYFGLTWSGAILKHIVGDSDALTIAGSLGGAVHDGYEDSAPPGRKKLGSTVLFRESLELAYQITPIYSISAMVDHMSNGDLANRNAGMTNAGARLGFKF
jgi:lipid A 3-O-deacylase